MKRTDFETILKRNIPKLQEYEPKENLWENISSNLDFDIELARCISNLPSYLPDENLWSKIDISIDTKSQDKNRRTRVIKLLRIPISIAASVLLVVTIYFALGKNNRITLSHTEEVSVEWQNKPETNEFKESIDPELFIEETCSKHSFVCDTEWFKEKSELLNELNQNLQRINDEISKYGTSVSLEKSKIKVENFKAQVVKELIKQIVS